MLLVTLQGASTIGNLVVGMMQVGAGVTISWIVIGLGGGPDHPMLLNLNPSCPLTPSGPMSETAGAPVGDLGGVAVRYYLLVSLELLGFAIFA